MKQPKGERSKSLDERRKRTIRAAVTQSRTKRGKVKVSLAPVKTAKDLTHA